MDKKNPRDSPGDLSEWRATAINSCEPSTSNKDKTLGWLDEIVPLCDSRRHRQEVVDEEFLRRWLRVTSWPWRRFERAEVAGRFLRSRVGSASRTRAGSLGAKLNLMSGASKSDLAQLVTKRSVSPEVHPTYYLITGLNYRYRLNLSKTLSIWKHLVGL